MNILTELFSQYSIETIFLLIVGLGVSIKFVGELFDFFYTKMKRYFNIQSQKDQQHIDLLNKISENTEMVSSLKEEITLLKNKIATLEEQNELTIERLQENTRSYIIDRHHYFCYDVGAIDDVNLQSLERRYLYYKAAGGNTFIDGLMEEVRRLPKLSLQNKEIVNAIHCFGVTEKDTSNGKRIKSYNN